VAALVDIMGVEAEVKDIRSMLAVVQAVKE
jgi:hypothetical protein